MSFGTVQYAHTVIVSQLLYIPCCFYQVFSVGILYVAAPVKVNKNLAQNSSHLSAAEVQLLHSARKYIQYIICKAFVVLLDQC